jgi:hypothetical protein
MNIISQQSERICGHVIRFWLSFVETVLRFGRSQSWISIYKRSWTHSSVRFIRWNYGMNC